MSPKAKGSERYREIRNPKAAHHYFIDERLEAGIVLCGTEVKSVRAGSAQISDAFVRIEKGVPILYHAHISEYSHGNLNNHNPYRPRRLLLHRKQIRELEQTLKAGGHALVPLRVYFKKALVKVELGLGRGKKQYDKRAALREKAEAKETARTVRHHFPNSMGDS